MFEHRITSELSLELVEPRHAAALFGLTDDNREHLREWLPWLDGVGSVDDTKAFIESAQKQLAEHRGFQTVIRFKEELVGIVGFHYIDWPSRTASIGYWLARSAEGRGIMTRACEAYVQHAFADLGLHRIEIRCAVHNVKSRAIPERLGFRRESTVRDAEWLYDRFVDHVVYGMSVSDWRDSAKRQSRRGGGQSLGGFGQ